jgi:hypothetical protein
VLIFAPDPVVRQTAFAQAAGYSSCIDGIRMRRVDHGTGLSAQKSASIAFPPAVRSGYGGNHPEQSAFFHTLWQRKPRLNSVFIKKRASSRPSVVPPNKMNQSNRYPWA